MTEFNQILAAARRIQADEHVTVDYRVSPTIDGIGLRSDARLLAAFVLAGQDTERLLTDIRGGLSVAEHTHSFPLDGFRTHCSGCSAEKARRAVDALRDGWHRFWNDSGPEENAEERGDR